ncbi:hypothetical protein BDZ45DRAFT_326423 [Acephala macrosclerotiorum]|nr:hypothetical protein BDZ45DRAFT_326423 [Acephala macrosclerotiorum]
MMMTEEKNAWNAWRREISACQGRILIDLIDRSIDGWMGLTHCQPLKWVFARRLFRPATCGWFTTTSNLICTQWGELACERGFVMEAVLKSTVDAAKIDQAFAELPRPFQGDPPAGVVVVVVVAVVVPAHVMCHERVEEGREASETSTAPDPTQTKHIKDVVVISFSGVSRLSLNFRQEHNELMRNVGISIALAPPKPM